MGVSPVISADPFQAPPQKTREDGFGTALVTNRRCMFRNGTNVQPDSFFVLSVFTEFTKKNER